MFDWIIKISAAAVVLSMVSNVLPIGKIRAASLIALGFLFLTLIIFPLKDVISEIKNNKFSIDIEKEMMLSQIENGDNNAYKEVLNTYKKRLNLELTNRLADKGYDLKDVNVVVDEDEKSTSFGAVQKVVATVGILIDKKEENKIDPVVVPEIVIDKNGISINDENIAENSENLSEEENEIKEIIHGVTGVGSENIVIQRE